jgi:hypothetical protein
MPASGREREARGFFASGTRQQEQGAPLSALGIGQPDMIARL